MKGETIRQLLVRVRRHYGDSYARFGKRLAEIQGRRPYDKEYMRKIEAGKKPVTASIAAGLRQLAHTAGLLEETNVRPAPGVAVDPGAICFRPSVRCGLCGIPMIPRRNRYCSTECRKNARKARV